MDDLKALQARLERAERALLRAGFQDLGGKEWKPPLGNPPQFIEVDPPKEPTERMLDAGRALYGANISPSIMRKLYIAMIAAHRNEKDDA